MPVGSSCLQVMVSTVSDGESIAKFAIANGPPHPRDIWLGNLTSASLLPRQCDNRQILAYYGNFAPCKIS